MSGSLPRKLAQVKIQVEPYLGQRDAWPADGRHILAQFNETSVVVYQAYRPAIGEFAARNGYFGGDFSFSRMSWFKPNFLWMMYRSGWGTKEGQETTLAIWIGRSFFDSVLDQGVPSTYDATLYADVGSWKKAVAASQVRLQWDPDHQPAGNTVARRAIQLGLRDRVLQEYAREAILEIEDISRFVGEQRRKAQPAMYQELLTPVERVYVPASAAIAAKLRISSG